MDSRAHNVSPAGEPGDTVYQKTTHKVDKDTDFDHDKNRIIRMKLFLSPNKERSLKTLKDVQTMWIPDAVNVSAPGESTDPGCKSCAVCEPHPVNIETFAVCSSPAPLLPLATGQSEPFPVPENEATHLVAQNFEDEKVDGEILDFILTYLESLDEETFQRTGGSAQVLSKSSMEYIMKKMLAISMGYIRIIIYLEPYQ